MNSVKHKFFPVSIVEKLAKYKVKLYIYSVNQFLRKKRHKKWIQDSFILNIFDLLISRAKKLVWWPPVFKPNFYIFSYTKQLRKIWRYFIDKFLLYHTSLTHFSPVSHFYTPWKRQKTFGFLTFSGVRFSDVFRGYRNVTLD